MSHELWLWVPFTIMIVTALAVDLGVLNRKAHRPSTREAGLWVLVWVALALAFNVFVYFWEGPERALEFLAGYLIEYSLSVDNLFVFIMIFSYFQVAPEYQHRVLFWGILGAVVIRGIFVAAGAALFEAFHWIPYVFGAFLVYTGAKMALARDEKLEPEANPVFRWARRVLPLTEGYEGEFFLVRRAGRLLATPLLLVLILVETTDVVFAVDSIPAVFAVSHDPLIVYTSNIFAILGLRSLFFLLAGIMDLFRFLKYGLSVILAFVGVKMLIAGFYKIPILASLGVIFTVLVVSVLASVLIPAPAHEQTAASGAEDPARTHTG
ncbi:TerC family protein [Caldinitratiruptor microaerophilus]|uniref:Membrane protein n=1 Tax=Caldinitratiruptor microaerophilus TaxID=671077 RepID=A0AA35CK60_9FIRM|nr:TerC family protein [Caldinitratiruptor microaerophilus]BDG59994.1 membrane protein [Caldinitratiruptor microaerophilus]